MTDIGLLEDDVGRSWDALKGVPYKHPALEGGDAAPAVGTPHPR
jgi:hypothetical protein